ncbi:MAG: hypothetical protein L6R39_005636 [Caloplaca ligustica]|nr:MAG: hypothetical protein L6R39_005636 [Caloplaca ligustica]
MGLINRLLSALPPSKGSSNDVSTGTPTKPEISRDEREAVWTWLPSIHVSALQILEQLVVRLEEGSMSLDQRLLDLATWTFEHEHDHVEIRKAVYKILPFLLSRYKGGAQGSTASSLAYCLRICCDDLLSTQGDSEYLQGNVGSTDVTTNKDPMNADAYHKRSDPPSTPSATLNDLQDSAALLLSAALENLPSSFLPSVRSTIDGMAVLSQSQPVLRSSVLNPPARRGRKQQSSVMPFLAQQFPNSPSTEALLRPRMPQLQLNATNHTEDTDEEVDEWEDTTRKPTRLSPEAVSDFKKGNFQASVETDRPETVELGLDSAEARPLSSDPQTYQAHGPDTVLPAKRSREPDTESLSHTASDRPEHLLPPGGEPERKRTRNGGQSLHVPPATEDDVSHPVTKVRSETVLAPTIDVPISAESMGSLWSTNEEIGDDDSDESSVPPIDPTMDTEDEEDEDEDEDEGAD